MTHVLDSLDQLAPQLVYRQICLLVHLQAFQIAALLGEGCTGECRAFEGSESKRRMPFELTRQGP